MMVRTLYLKKVCETLYTTCTVFANIAVFIAPSKPSRPSGSKKLQRLLGDDVYDNYVNTVATDLQPWYLRPNYSPSDIIIEPDGSVRGGTLSALVERLTAHEQAGKFQNSFSNQSFLNIH